MWTAYNKFYYIYLTNKKLLHVSLISLNKDSTNQKYRFILNTNFHHLSHPHSSFPTSYMLQFLTLSLLASCLIHAHIPSIHVFILNTIRYKVTVTPKALLKTDMGQNSSLVVCSARWPAWYRVMDSILLWGEFSGRRDFSHGVNMS